MDIITLALAKKYVQESISDIISGKDGKSAYDIAVENGFEGSEKEWLDSLKGQSPHIGDNGHWYVGTLDTGVIASPDLSGYYSEANLVALSTEEILEICK
jgi:hypothetical protein